MLTSDIFVVSLKLFNEEKHIKTPENIMFSLTVKSYAEMQM